MVGPEPHPILRLCGFRSPLSFASTCPRILLSQPPIQAASGKINIPDSISFAVKRSIAAGNLYAIARTLIPSNCAASECVYS